jgi:hypothetical protein
MDFFVVFLIVIALGFLSLAVFIGWFGFRKDGPVRQAWTEYKKAKGSR